MPLPRSALRLIHLATTPLLGAFIYSASLRENEAFVALIQWGVFPLAALAGLAMWQGPRLMRRLAGRLVDDLAGGRQA